MEGDSMYRGLIRGDHMGHETALGPQGVFIDLIVWGLGLEV